MSYEYEVGKYISTLPEWQQSICNTLRSVIHEVDPEIQEVVKRKALPYFVIDGKNVCALLAAKDHVNLFVYDPIADDPERVINQGEGNATARSIQVYEDQKVNVQGVKKLLLNVVANNKAGGWRKLRA